MKCRTTLVTPKASREQPVARGRAAVLPAPQDAAGISVGHALIEDATAIYIALQAYENWSARQEPEALREARLAFDTLKQGCIRLTARLRLDQPG